MLIKPLLTLGGSFFIPMLQVEQPCFISIDKDDPLKWAKFGRIHSDWLRKVAPQLELNTEILVIADVVTSIIGDDENCFLFYSLSTCDLARASILERLSWELSIHEVPNNIKNLIITIKSLIEASPSWQDKKSFNDCYKQWKIFKEAVNEIAQKEKKIVKALAYYKEHSELLSVYYQSFLSTFGLN